MKIRLLFMSVVLMSAVVSLTGCFFGRKSRQSSSLATDLNAPQPAFDTTISNNSGQVASSKINDYGSTNFDDDFFTNYGSNSTNNVGGAKNKVSGNVGGATGGFNKHGNLNKSSDLSSRSNTTVVKSGNKSFDYSGSNAKVYSSLKNNKNNSNTADVATKKSNVHSQSSQMGSSAQSRNKKKMYTQEELDKILADATKKSVAVPATGASGGGSATPGFNSTASSSAQLQSPKSAVNSSQSGHVSNQGAAPPVADKINVKTVSSAPVVVNSAVSSTPSAAGVSVVSSGGQLAVAAPSVPAVPLN